MLGTGTCIALTPIGAMFALSAGSPHGLNVHVVGVIVVGAGVLGRLLTSRLPDHEGSSCLTWT
jgi:hypothetical protein